MKIEVSIGEVFDKISILEIKLEQIKDPIKLEYIEKELASIYQDLHDHEIEIPTHLKANLREANWQLWQAEDILRELGGKGDYGPEFLHYAILDATINDQRFVIKNQINELCDSSIKEQKSYEDLYTAN
tara:strand:+ start:30086 stop:30472 length:387 start_codon:yes stop_codon:yes gene_type:complete